MAQPSNNVRQVFPVTDDRLAELCRKAYPDHPRGCPNWNRKAGCPPRSLPLRNVLDLSSPIYCIYNRFDLAGHVAKMRQRLPDWSDRQLKCCLYWQGTARKQLRLKVEQFLNDHPGLIALYTPEACGVDVTATMASVGIELQWPVETVAYQVALAGGPRLL